MSGLRLCILMLILALAQSATSGALAAEQTLAWDFEGTGADWNFIACKGELADIAGERSIMNRAMKLNVTLPTPASMTRPIDLAELSIDRLAYSIYVPEDAPKDVKTLLFFKDKDGLWFQNLREEPLEPGKWSTHSVDLSPNSIDLHPKGHYRRWNKYVASKMNQIGIKFISSTPYRGPLYVDAIHGSKQQEKQQPLKLLNLHINSPTVDRFEKFEITFLLNRSFNNPFDPEEVDIEGVFTAPSGSVSKIPAFYFQEFLSTRHYDEEELTPVGQSCWKIRFAPTEVGTYSFTIRCRVKNQQPAAGENEHETLTTAARSFTANPSKNPGFMRVSKEDYRCFELDNGRLFYLIGHNFRSPNDNRSAEAVYHKREPFPDRGTYAYEDVFPKMAANGENYAEVWMASWWLDIEWIARWKGFQGLGDYNLATAWKLDRVLSLARKYGIRVHLVIDNHGKTSSWCDLEWDVSPYNIENGGFLTYPEEFFTNSRARRLYKRKMRYIIARWGYDTTIAGIELWSELDLTGSNVGFQRDSRKVHWHREMTDYIKTIDPWDHLLTTHYSTNYTRIDPQIVTLPNIDYVVVDAYRQGNDRRSIGHLLKETYDHCRQWKKPNMVTEYGGSPWANSPPMLESDLHAGLWAGWMLPMAGTPLLWWFEFIERGYSGDIDGDGLFFHYKALAEYSRGEERRDPGLNTAAVMLQGRTHGLLGMSLQSKDRAYCWIYDERAMQSMPKEAHAQQYGDVKARLYNLDTGKYSVEFWDTYDGGEIKGTRKIVETAGTMLEFELPDFKRDIAVKVKALDAPKTAEQPSTRGRR